jgi:hypothetical protein
MATPTTLPATFTAGQVLTAAQMNNLRGAFRVLQVVQTVKSDTFSTTSATFTDVTGLSATITPSATSSKILIAAFVNFSSTTGAEHGASIRLDGGNSGNFVGDAASNRIRAAAYSNNNTGWVVGLSILPSTIVYLDSPATTSATTYKVQARRNNAGTMYLNRTDTDADSAVYARTPSSITVMEISA